MYKSIFAEASFNFEKEKEIVDKIVEFFIQNPYPKDHEGVHKLAESLGIEPSIIETFIYALLSCFLAGGTYNKSGKDKADFSEDEIKKSLIVEQEHIDTNNKTPIIQYMSKIISGRIGLDHITDRKDYYSFGKKFGIFEELN